MVGGDYIKKKMDVFTGRGNRDKKEKQVANDYFGGQYKENEDRKNKAFH